VNEVSNPAPMNPELTLRPFDDFARPPAVIPAVERGPVLLVPRRPTRFSWTIDGPEPIREWLWSLVARCWAATDRFPNADHGFVLPPPLAQLCRDAAVFRDDKGKRRSIDHYFAVTTVAPEYVARAGWALHIPPLGVSSDFDWPPRIVLWGVGRLSELIVLPAAGPAPHHGRVLRFGAAFALDEARIPIRGEIHSLDDQVVTELPGRRSRFEAWLPATFRYVDLGGGSQPVRIAFAPEFAEWVWKPLRPAVEALAAVSARDDADAAQRKWDEQRADFAKAIQPPPKKQGPGRRRRRGPKSEK
jgi:hypothetical protein